MTNYTAPGSAIIPYVAGLLAKRLQNPLSKAPTTSNGKLLTPDQISLTPSQMPISGIISMTDGFVPNLPNNNVEPFLSP